MAREKSSSTLARSRSDSAHADVRSCSARSFFCNDTASTEIYTLSLHDALPIPRGLDMRGAALATASFGALVYASSQAVEDRKSTRLNSSHLGISYAVFCLKKKKKNKKTIKYKKKKKKK